MAFTIPPKFAFRAFYDGTSLGCPFDDTEGFYKMTVKEANEMIVASLRDGQTLQDIIAMCKGQQEKWEAAMCAEQERLGKETFLETDQETLVARVMGMDGNLGTIYWFLNTAVLLRLKAIQNDNMNGWLFARRR